MTPTPEKSPDQIGMDHKMSSRSYLVIFVVIFGAAVICVINFYGLSSIADTLGLFQKNVKVSSGAEQATGAKSSRRKRQSSDIGDESPNSYEVRSSRYTTKSCNLI